LQIENVRLIPIIKNEIKVHASEKYLNTAKMEKEMI